jgi:hypothetical protein
MKIKLVVATRASREDFFVNTATGRSLAFNAPSFIDLHLYPNNTRGLSSIYNEVIMQCKDDPAKLVFAHDDLHLLDFFWFFRVTDGLENFDIVGLVGNRRRLPRQPGWCFLDDNFTPDKPENLSGVVAHGRTFPPSNLNVFGLPRQRVLLLDGLFLASDSKTLLEHKLFFDERFDFHFYDLDFCRQAEMKGLSCGTIDLSLIHESGGAFGSKEWRASYQTYLEKWGE